MDNGALIWFNGISYWFYGDVVVIWWWLYRISWFNRKYLGVRFTVFLVIVRWWFHDDMRWYFMSWYVDLLLTFKGDVMSQRFNWKSWNMLGKNRIFSLRTVALEDQESLVKSDQEPWCVPEAPPGEESIWSSEVWGSFRSDESWINTRCFPLTIL